CNFRDAIGAARVIRRSHGNLCAPIEGRFGDAEIVRGDDEAVQSLRPPATFPDLTEQRLAGYFMERFARETGRAPARGNDAGGFSHFVAKQCRQRRRYHGRSNQRRCWFHPCRIPSARESFARWRYVRSQYHWLCL